MKYILLVALFTTLTFAAVVHPTKYWVFREDCFDRFLAFDLDPECVKFSFFKALGFAIVAGSCLFKLPQINKMMSAKSAEGVPAISLYAEFINLIGLLGNSLRLNLSFSVYGESVFTNVQNTAIIYLIWQYNKSISLIQKVLFLVFTAIYSYVLLEGSLMTEQYWDFVVSSQLLLILITRVPMIVTAFQEKSTGANAFATFFLAFVGTAARTMTVIMESDDFMYRL